LDHRRSTLFRKACSAGAGSGRCERPEQIKAQLMRRAARSGPFLVCSFSAGERLRTLLGSHRLSTCAVHVVHRTRPRIRMNPRKYLLMAFSPLPEPTVAIVQPSEFGVINVRCRLAQEAERRRRLPEQTKEQTDWKGRRVGGLFVSSQQERTCDFARHYNQSNRPWWEWPLESEP